MEKTKVKWIVASVKTLHAITPEYDSYKEACDKRELLLKSQPQINKRSITVIRAPK